MSIKLSCNIIIRQVRFIAISDERIILKVAIFRKIKLLPTKYLLVRTDRKLLKNQKICRKLGKQEDLDTEGFWLILQNFNFTERVRPTNDPMVATFFYRRALSGRMQRKHIRTCGKETKQKT
jgi:hypothetical protein